MLDPEEQLVKLNSGGRLDETELDEVLALLESTDVQELGRKLSADDIYSLLLVIGRTKDTRYRGLLERYLDAKDALTVSLVLEILCLQWGPIEECLEWLLDFALGSAWDDEDDVRQTALRILGDYLCRELPKNAVPAKTKKKDPRALKVLGLVVSIFEDDTLERATRQAAYYSLLRASGISWENVPSEFARLDLNPGSKDIDWELLSRLKNMLEGYSSGSSISSLPS
jgi:hypothetical protein